MIFGNVANFDEYEMCPIFTILYFMKNYWSKEARNDTDSSSIVNASLLYKLLSWTYIFFRILKLKIFKALILILFFILASY